MGKSFPGADWKVDVAVHAPTACAVCHHIVCTINPLPSGCQTTSRKTILLGQWDGMEAYALIQVYTVLCE